MNQATIEKAIAEGAEAVEKLIQAETDRRVTQAREKWEKELPTMVEQEIETRQAREKERAEQRLTISQQIDAAFEGSGITADTWGDLIDVDGLLDLDDAARTEKIEAEAQRVQGVIDRVLKSKFVGKAPAGTDENADTGTPEQAFKQQLIQNMR